MKVNLPFFIHSLHVHKMKVEVHVKFAKKQKSRLQLEESKTELIDATQIIIIIILVSFLI